MGWIHHTINVVVLGIGCEIHPRRRCGIANELSIFWHLVFDVKVDEAGVDVWQDLVLVHLVILVLLV